MLKQFYELGFGDDYLFVYDCETTGLSEKSNKLIQVGGLLLKRDDEGLYRYHCFVNDYINHPGLVLPSFIVDLTGITDEKLHLDGHHPELVKRRTIRLLQDKNVRFIAHNIAFDKKFLNAFLEEDIVTADNTFCTLKHFESITKQKFIDSHIEKHGGAYSRSYGAFVYINGGDNPGKHKWSTKGGLKLSTLQETYNIDHEVTHNALDDLIVLLNLLEYINKNPIV